MKKIFKSKSKMEQILNFLNLKKTKTMTQANMKQMKKKKNKEI